MSGVPAETARGGHAHKSCHQLLICTSGSVRVSYEDGQKRRAVLLSSPVLGLHIPPLVWSSQFDFSPGAVLLVLASDLFEPFDYIHNYDEFLELVRSAT